MDAINRRREEVRAHGRKFRDIAKSENFHVFASKLRISYSRGCGGGKWCCVNYTFHIDSDDVETLVKAITALYGEPSVNTFRGNTYTWNGSAIPGMMLEVSAHGVHVIWDGEKGVGW